MDFLISEFRHFGNLEFLNFWIFEFLNFWIFDFLNFRIFEFLNFWIYGFLNFWIFEFWNFGIFDSSIRALLFVSRLSTTFRGYLCRMVGYSSLLGFRRPFTPIFSGLPINPSTFWAIICTEKLHPLDLDIDGTDPLEKKLNCFNPGFRLTFLAI